MSDARAELPGVAASEGITPAELRLAARNHALPLEALSYDVTPIGLHYLLIHYDIPVVDAARWRLSVGGCVARELSLSLDDLRSRPAVTAPVTMECAGNGRAQLSPRPLSQPWLLEAVGTAEWTGTPLRGVLEYAGVTGEGVDVVFRGLDRGVEGGEEQQYARSLPLSEASSDAVLLAYAMNGEPLPPQHGFPLRLIVPGWYGMTSVKWLDAITVVDEPFAGYQQARGYRLRQTPEEAGEPVSRMQPRSLMAPPGIPDFATRERIVGIGPCSVRGRAWSGFGPIERVELSADGGASWSDARLGPQTSTSAWRAWEWDWSHGRQGNTRSARAPRTGPRTSSRSRRALEPGRLREQRSAAGAGHRPPLARRGSPPRTAGEAADRAPDFEVGPRACPPPSAPARLVRGA